MKIVDLKEPYPYTSDLTEAVQTILFIGVFVCLFVLVFISQNLVPDNSWLVKIRISGILGMLAIIIALFNTIIIHTLLPAKKKREWRVIDEVLLYLLHFSTISVANYLYSLQLLGDPFSILEFFKRALITVLVGGIPVSLHLLNKQKKILQENFASADSINESATNIQDKTIEDSLLTFNELSIDLNEVLYFESDKNYINVIVKDGQPKRVRGTLKKLDELISKPSNFIRCHSAFIVNLYFIKDVTGNAQGLRLNLGNNAVPVSRKYIRQIRNKLQVANV